jgi:aquaporin Z
MLLTSSKKESSMTSNRFAAEFVGTFVLVFGGVGTAVLAGDGVGTLGISLAFGLSLLVMAYAIGPISGCHINPAVTLGVLLKKGIVLRDAAFYWVAQVVGAIVAAGLLLMVAKGREGGYDAGEAGLGANGYAAHSPGGFDLAAAFTVELALTALLVFVVLGATHRLAETAFAGLPIGFALVLIHLVSIPVTNTSVNPARSIGPALFVGDWAVQQLWLFIVAPLVGAVVGWLLHSVVFGTAGTTDRVEPEASAVAAG